MACVRRQVAFATRITFHLQTVCPHANRPALLSIQPILKKLNAINLTDHAYKKTESHFVLAKMVGWGTRANTNVPTVVPVPGFVCSKMVK